MTRIPTTLYANQQRDYSFTFIIVLLFAKPQDFQELVQRTCKQQIEYCNQAEICHENGIKMIGKGKLLVSSMFFFPNFSKRVFLIIKKNNNNYNKKEVVFKSRIFNVELVS